MDRLVPSMATKRWIYQHFQPLSRAQGAPKPHPNRAQATQSAIYCAISMAYAKRAQMGNSECFRPGTQL